MPACCSVVVNVGYLVVVFVVKLFQLRSSGVLEEIVACRGSGCLPGRFVAGQFLRRTVECVCPSCGWG